MRYDIKPGIKGLIFDLDGTLADTMPYHFKGWKIACKKFGADIDTAFLRKHTGTPGWIIADEIIKKCKLNGSVTIDQIMEENLLSFIKINIWLLLLKLCEFVKKHYGILPMAVGTGRS